MSSPDKPALKRVVTMPMLALYGIGNIVGAGVYVLIGKFAEPAGYFAVVAFLIAALVAFCAALCYAELAARFPVSAGVSVYLHEAFKTRRLSTIVGLMLVAAGTISTATLLKGFAGYFSQIMPLPAWVSIVGMSVLLIVVILRGIKESVGVAALLTLLEVGGLIFLVGSILVFQPGAVSNYTAGFAATAGTLDPALLAGVISGAFVAFYAFVGFEDMVNIAEEVKQPQVASPRAILISLAVVTVLYLAVAVTVLGVLPPGVVGASPAPLAEAYRAATGNSTFIIVVVSLLATLNGVVVNIVMGSRFLYGMAGRGWIPAWFSKVSGRHVPAQSVLLVGALAVLAALALPIDRLAQLTSLLLLCVFVAVNVSLIVIRRRRPDRSLRLSPGFIPWLGAITSVGLLVSQAWVLVAKV
jgi:basic amino acid/polyamine antiporter, APA family